MASFHFARIRLSGLSDTWVYMYLQEEKQMMLYGVMLEGAAYVGFCAAIRVGTVGGTPENNFSTKPWML